MFSVAKVSKRGNEKQRTLRKCRGRYVYQSFFFSDHCIKQIDSMLPWVCSVIHCRSQRTSKCGKNVCDTLTCGLRATSLFLPHFDVICDLLLNRRIATWNLFQIVTYFTSFFRMPLNLKLEVLNYLYLKDMDFPSCQL